MRRLLAAAAGKLLGPERAQIISEAACAEWLDKTRETTSA